MPRDCLILFVCTGNTCRSPMAEGLMRKACKNYGHVQITSAGTSTCDGLPASREARQVMEECYGIDLSKHRSQEVDIELIEEADLVLCMTRSHRDVLLDWFPEFKEKFFLVMEFAGNKDYRGKGDVYDPYGCGIPAYKQCCKCLLEAIPGILAYLRLPV